jgi:hypothetical protein
VIGAEGASRGGGTAIVGVGDELPAYRKKSVRKAQAAPKPGLAAETGIGGGEIKRPHRVARVE